MSAVETQPWIPEETFGDRLRMLRKRLDLTTNEIGNRVGIPGPTWSSWENGASPQRMDERVNAISEALGVDRGWLMWGIRSRCLSLVETPDGQLSGDDLGWAIDLEGPTLAVVGHSR